MIIKTFFRLIYTQNSEKWLILDSSLGRRNFFLGRGLDTPELNYDFANDVNL
jgi:hypothetical protein